MSRGISSVCLVSRLSPFLDLFSLFCLMLYVMSLITPLMFLMMLSLTFCSLFLLIIMNIILIQLIMTQNELRPLINNSLTHLVLTSLFPFFLNNSLMLHNPPSASCSKVDDTGSRSEFQHPHHLFSSCLLCLIIPLMTFLFPIILIIPIIIHTFST